MTLPRVLFVCIENSNRSQMAEAFARIHGVGVIDAQSCGSRPSGKVNPRAIQFMAERGYDLTQHSSKSLEAFNGTKVAVAVTMGCGDYCPLVLAERREDWNIPDPKDLSDDEFRRIRDLIERKVQALIAELRSPKSLTARVQQVLREQAPALNLDPNELEVLSVENGIASVRLSGVCASCPATIPTLLMQLEHEVRQQVPEVEVLELVGEHTS